MKSLIKTLADEFGLSQQQIADYLGIHFSIVSRIRSGDRNLPLKAIEKGSLMLQALQRIPSKKKKLNVVNPHQLSNRMLWIREQIINCQLQIRQLEISLRQLNQQKNRYDKANALLSCLSEIHNATASEKQRRWLAETQYNINTNAKKCDTEEQWLLEIKLKGIQSLQHFYEQQLSVIKNQINKS